MKPRTFVAWSFFGGLQHDTLNMTPYFQIYSDLGSTELSSRQPGEASGSDECSDEEEAELRLLLRSQQRWRLGAAPFDRLLYTS